MFRCLHFLLVVLFIAAPASTGGADDALRIGVSFIPPADDTPRARLYTEEGFDIALAQELGRAVGRPVRLIVVADGDQASALGTGSVDALFTRLAWDDPLRDAADVTPSSYVSGLSVSMRSDTEIRSWTDLENKTVCVSEANLTAQRYLHKLGAKLRIERAPARTLAFVRSGSCDAAVHDDVLLKHLFADRNWQKFSATLPVILPSELVLLLPRQSGNAVSKLRTAFLKITEPASWNERYRQWATNVALEVYLDQDGPDCH
jgi:polar amino acid transport system substrate-binding protein